MSLLSRLAVQAARAYGILSSRNTNVPASYLVVAGGGGGGGSRGGGGGAGGLLTSTFTISTLNTYSISVGAGGSGNGNNSYISGTGLSTVTATGGGAGATASGGSGIPGNAGGSGGGGATDAFTGTNAGAGGAGTSGQGNNGGSSATVGGALAAGGGGGAGAVGGNASGTTAGSGGNGTASSISGSSVTYAGGGGGGTNGGTNGSGGTGGGGAGGTGGNGTANTGGGGGGGNPSTAPGTGGSGIVIISYASATPRFVGGTLTTSGGNQIHTFTSSGTLSPITPITASYLVVAGGGGAGRTVSGGGGGGGYLTSSTTLYSGATYVVTVGGGGAVGATLGARGTNGGNSVISGTGLTTITSLGGGGGGADGTGTVAERSGNSGGSGGGAVNVNGVPGAGTSGQGNAGGNGSTNCAGGGGGAGAVGGNGSGNIGGTGGNGLQSSISGTATYYAGGGGGGGYNTASTNAGGLGGGGNGTNDATNSTPGTPNSGGGGGGAGFTGAPAGTSASGGSGIVIISYAGSQVFNGGLVTSSGGNTIHTFTSSGALTPLTNNLTNSLRFRSSASAYLQRTPTVTGSLTTWTASCWYKNGVMNTNETLFSNAVASDSIGFRSGRVMEIYFGAGSANLVTTPVFRDPSAWYHIVVAVDTTQATAANRIKLYVNGNQVTAFSTATYPSQNYQTSFNRSGYNQEIGRRSSDGAYPIDGYFADINWVDGQALEPYYFGNNDANGVWKPIKYTGMYGTNGYYLTFGNTTSTTTIGYDTSGNNNNFTSSGISLTAGTTYDAMTDVPTNTSATTANYAVMNPLWKDGTTVIAQGNLDVSNGNYGGFSTLTIPTNSKFYAEFTVTATQGNQGVGILKAANAYSGVISQADMFSSNSVTYYSTNGNKFVLGGGSTAYGSSWGTIGDVIGIAVNTVDNQITFYKNNTSQGVITGLTSGIEWVFATGNQTNTGGGAWNFGQRPFSYTPPTDFVRLNTFNLPTPTILQGNKYFDSTTYAAASPTNRVIVNQGQFRPDLVWIKSRSQTYNHYLFDSNRGVGAGALSSNLTSVQNWDTGTQLSSFNANGYTISSGDAISDTSAVAWQWQAGQGSTSSNTSGSITSTVSVSTTAGFSVVTYTSQASGTATFGHGLGVAPSMILLKARNLVGGWYVYHSALGGTKYLALQAIGAATTASDGWNNTNPTSTVVSVGNGYAGSYNMVAYCWAEIAGFSKFGSFTGNNSLDGPFIYLGFRPSFFMVKRTDVSSDWFMLDDQRPTFNVIGAGNGGQLAANQTYAESTLSTYAIADFLSNGVKVRSDMSYGYWNASGGTYIYAAFAENPFKNANAR